MKSLEVKTELAKLVYLAYPSIRRQVHLMDEFWVFDRKVCEDPKLVRYVRAASMALRFELSYSGSNGLFVRSPRYKGVMRLFAVNTLFSTHSYGGSV